MTADFTTPLTVEQMYGEWGIEWEDVVAIPDESLDPRPRTSIYDTFAALGVRGPSYVLDIGGRDSTQAFDLAAPGRVFDAIFSRDMMGHVLDLEGALAECRRVLKSGGAMLIHDVFATPLLEPEESARLCAHLAQVPERLDSQLFEETLHAAGFAIETIDRMASEWLESLLEKADGEVRLLRAARLNRNKERFIEMMGEVPYRVVRGNNLWTIYRLIGKLEDRVYVIRATG